MIPLVLLVFLIVNIAFGAVFAYFDLKSRNIHVEYVLGLTAFLLVEVVYLFAFQYSPYLFIPIALTIILTIISLTSGHIGLGDIPLLASYLLVLFALPNLPITLIGFGMLYVSFTILIVYLLYRNILFGKRQPNSFYSMS